MDHIRLHMIRALRAELYDLTASLEELPTWALTQFAQTLELIHRVRTVARGHVEPPVDDEPSRGPVRATRWTRS